MNNTDLKIIGKNPKVHWYGTIEDFMVTSGVCDSKREARTLKKQGGFSMNKEKVEDKYTHLLMLSNCRWDINNKALCPFYLLTKEDVETESYKEEIKNLIINE